MTNIRDHDLTILDLLFKDHRIHSILCELQAARDDLAGKEERLDLVYFRPAPRHVEVVSLIDGHPKVIDWPREMALEKTLELLKIIVELPNVPDEQ